MTADCRLPDCRLNYRLLIELKDILSQSAPVPLLGNILDNLTFANNLYKMADKAAKDQVNEAPENQADIDINSDENQSGTTHLNEPVAEESELEKTKASLAEMNDKYVRKIAEFDNFRRRSAKERLDTIQTAGREVIASLLDVLDDSERAQKQLETTDDLNQIREGVKLVFNKLKNTMQSKGLKPMETVGKDFDPDLHEAITEIPAPAEELKGKVVDEVVKGYYLNDKIIRHAKVVVGK
jgi:molecular chaperone GrpE